MFDQLSHIWTEWTLDIPHPKSASQISNQPAGGLYTGVMAESAILVIMLIRVNSSV